MLEWARTRSTELDADLTRSIEDGFGATSGGEDPFDATIGLFSMLEVVTGRRSAGAPADPDVRNVEGWILGQQG